MANDRGGFAKLLYNAEEKTVLGRTATSWFKILAFYTVYYAFLALLFYGSVQLTQKSLKLTGPDLTKPEGLPKVGNTRLDQPGVTVYPQQLDLDDSDGLGFDLNSEKYQTKMKEFLDPYATNPNFAKENGDFFKMVKPFFKDGKVKTSLFELSKDNPEPIVFLSLNRVINWVPVGASELSKEEFPEVPCAAEECETLWKAGSNSFEKDNLYFKCMEYNAKMSTFVYESKYTFDYAVDSNMDFKGRAPVGLLAYTGNTYDKEEKLIQHNKPFVAVRISCKENGGPCTTPFSSDQSRPSFRCIPLLKNTQYDATRQNGEGYIDFGFAFTKPTPKKN